MKTEVNNNRLHVTLSLYDLSNHTHYFIILISVGKYIYCNFLLVSDAAGVSCILACMYW